MTQDELSKRCKSAVDVYSPIVEATRLSVLARFYGESLYWMNGKAQRASLTGLSQALKSVCSTHFEKTRHSRLWFKTAYDSIRVYVGPGADESNDTCTSSKRWPRHLTRENIGRSMQPMSFVLVLLTEVKIVKVIRRLFPLPVEIIPMARGMWPVN